MTVATDNGVHRVEPGRLLVGLGLALAVVVAWFAVDALAPRGLPLGIAAHGLLVGALNALLALGLVLIYRAGKYINFAHGSIGAVGAVVAGRLVTINDWNYFLAIVVGVLTSVALGGLVELLVIRRLFKAPRLVITVATIGLAQFFIAFEIGLSVLWEPPTGVVPRLQMPLSGTVTVGAVVFRPQHLLVLAVFPLLLGALVAFFRYTDFGIAVQAVAENADRARLLGVSVRKISTVVWMLAGLLAGATAVLQAPIVGSTFGATVGPALLLRALAPAMIGGLDRIGVAVGAGLALGVIEQAVTWNTDVSGPVEATLFLVILVALLVQRRRRARTTEGEEQSFAASSRVRPFPRELTAVRSIRWFRRGLRVAVLAVAVALPLFLGLTQRVLAAVVLVYMLAALSLTLLSGYAGQVSFGHWAFVGFGALLGGWLTTAVGLPVLVSAVLACAGGGLLALLIGLPALRIRGLYLGVVTLAFAVSSSAYLFRLPMFRVSGAVPAPRLGPLDFRDELSFYYLCLGVLLAAIWVVRNIRATTWGRNFVAVRDNDRAAATYGVDPVVAKLLAFVTSGVLASLAGMLYVISQGTLTAGAFPVDQSLQLFAAVVIGGLGSIPGAIIAALYLRGIQFFAPAVQLFTTSVGLLAILLAAPNGLAGVGFGLRDHALRWYARRNGIHVPSLVADSRIGVDALRDAASAAEPSTATEPSTAAEPAGPGGRPR